MTQYNTTTEIPDYMDELSETYRKLMEPATHRTIPDNRTTEEKTAKTREDLILYAASETIRRTGWYYTEGCLPKQYPIEG